MLKNTCKKLILSLFVFLSIVGFSSKAFAFSGALASYSMSNASYPLTDVGVYQITSFTTYGHVYVEHYNDSLYQPDEGVNLTLLEHEWNGYTRNCGTQTATGTGETDLTFALPEQGTYKFFFNTNIIHDWALIHGTVYDYKN